MVDEAYLTSLMQECFPMYFIATVLVATSQLYINSVDEGVGMFQNAALVRSAVPSKLYDRFARTWPLDAAENEFRATVVPARYLHATVTAKQAQIGAPCLRS